MNTAKLFSRLTASRFIRFGIVGAAGYVVNLAILFVAHGVLKLDAYVAGALSIFLSMNFTWLGNRTITFPDQAARSPRAMAQEWLRFIASNSLGAVLNYSVYASLVALAEAPLNNPYLAQIAGVAIGLISNFTLSKTVVFRGEQAPSR